VDLAALDYALPPELVAQHPLAHRDDARLLVVERASGRLTDAVVRELPGWLRAGDALVLNETRVLPARLFVRRPPGWGRVELLFVRREESGLWRALARPARKLAPGIRLESEDRALRLEVAGVEPAGERLLRVTHGDVEATLEALGQTPLPPYIRRPPEPADRERYQTVFARVPGAVAAPTAGLHFTPELLADLERHGVRSVRLLLHVGPGTFRPITAERVEEHALEAEWFEVGEDAARALQAARAAGGRLFAAGTTVVRALESAADAGGGELGAARGFTSKFIYPPYAFRAVDALLTNFHLPRTSLLCLVAAFAGTELTRRAYAHAVEERYRFYSYGDAMLVL
jgi:S-adenosylmethionine:tRNA ribosyltransferase-isomerase